MTTITVGKLDAGRRQLNTAIWLFFNGGDPVSAHALAFASYEIAHTISKKRDPSRRDLIFDSLVIRDERRADFNKLIKKDANFFKHGDRDGDAVIQFNPEMTEFFILFAIFGFELCGERKSPEEIAFIWWLTLQKPDLLTEGMAKQFVESIPRHEIGNLRGMRRSEFFKQFMEARKYSGI